MPLFHTVTQGDVWTELDYLVADPTGSAGGSATFVEMISVYKARLISCRSKYDNNDTIHVHDGVSMLVLLLLLPTRVHTLSFWLYCVVL